jgi:FMN phosphatase YigB (HAD superfamily)
LPFVDWQQEGFAMLNYVQSVNVMDGTERSFENERMVPAARLEGQPGQSKAVPRGASARAGVARASVYPAQAEALRMMIEQAQIISFDVFDTLLIRPFANPADVFLLMERQTGLAGFHDARIRAEQAARDRLYAKTGSAEVTLAQIYEALKLPESGLRALDRRALMRLEVETETALLTRSPAVGAVYDLARELGKPVIAVSDMYLPEPVIAQILAANGLAVDRLFVSCAHQASKHEGSLYGIVCAAMKAEPAGVLHFGDNFKSDCSAALEAGVAGYYLPSLYDQLYRDNRFNQAAVSQLCRRGQAGQGDEKNLFASAVVAYLARFKATHPTASMAAQFGAMYGGPLVTGFSAWMNVTMQTDKVRHLRLATRDGYITKEIWDRLGFSGQASIMQSSRRLTMLPALCKAFETEIGALLNTSTTCTMRECIARLGLGDGAAELLEVLGRLTPLDRPIDNPIKAQSALKALKDSSSLLIRIAETEMEAYKTYLDGEGFDPRHDAMADCGWALSSQRRTEQMLGETFRGYYIGTLEHAHMHDKIRSFLFHKGDDKGWVEIAERGVELLELPFASTHRQVCRFEKTGAPGGSAVRPVLIEQEAQYDVVRIGFIHKMHDEIRSFADFIKPVIGVITMEELREGLFILFEALVNKPTPYEYHELATLPHNREFGASGFATVGTFWVVGGSQYVSQSQKTRWRDYVRLGWSSLRQAGPGATWVKAKRVLRRKLGGPG